MSDEKAEKKAPSVYISSPGYNAPQRIGSEKLQQIIEDAGYTPVLPMVSAEVPEVKEAEGCLGSLRDADLVVAWLDGLTAEGVSIYTINSIQTKVEINFPPEAIELMQAGAVTMAKMGKGGKKRRGIVLPHELNSPPPIPAGMVADYGQQGLALCGLLGQPMNIPDLSTVCEVMYAFASGKPVIALSLVEPFIGMYLGWVADIYVDSFAKLGEVLKEFYPDALTGGGERRAALAKLQTKHGHSPHGRIRQYLREREAAARAETEDIETPPIEPEKKDATN